MNISAEDKKWVDSVFEKIDKKLSKVAVRSRDKLPYTTVDGVHDDRTKTDVTWWTNGFWGGMMWLMYEATGNEEYKKTAERSEELLDAATEDYAKLHHDVGFMWHLTSGASYRLTGNKASLRRNLFSAATLASRYNIDGRFIRAWNGGEERAGWTIIDCMMNIPLLYWATDIIGDDRFKKIAMAHADTAVRDHIRGDGSVVHIVEHDLNTGDLVKTYGGQGYGEGSCWTRGQAWAVYGTILSYIHTGKKEYLDAAMRTANYFIANCAPFDYKTPIDFRQPPEPVYYDSTAGVCTACGLLEIAKCVSEAESKAYTEAAIKILKATAENWTNFEDNEDSLVGMGSERYPHDERALKGLHIPIIYGDFFFVEAILKLKGREFLIW